jgi:List-Bact-rpt repeat protein/VCBS repeat protein
MYTTLAVAAAVLVIGTGSATASAPTFSFQTASFNMPDNANDTPQSIAIGDLDGVNGNDVVVVGYGGDLSIFLNNGLGGFEAGQHIFGSCLNGGSAGVAIGSFSTSGHPDLLVACSDAINDGFLRYQGNGDGTFQAPERAAPIQAYAGENDQRQPVFVGNMIENMVHGQFGGAQSIVWNELDCGNGCGYYLCTLPDQYFATDFGSTECSIDVNDQGQVTGGVEFQPPFVLGTLTGTAAPPDWAFTIATSDVEGQHYGTLVGAVHDATTPPPDYIGGFFSDNFEPQDAQPTDGRLLAAGDLNGDGTSEIVSGYAGVNQDQLALYQLAGAPDNGGTFAIADPVLYGTNPTLQAWYGGAVADFDGDGNLDVVVLGSDVNASTDFQVFPGDGTGSLGAAQSFAVADFTTEAPMASGDVNGDGHPDLVTTVGAAEGQPARLVVLYDTSAAVQTQTLTVSKAGSGAGSVTSLPSGIDCGATCSAQFTSGAQVTLTATPAAGSVFDGWSGGGCSGTGTCTVTLNADTTVTATFALLPPNTKITKSTINSKKGHATFKFIAIGDATGFQCALKKAGKTAVFKSCHSPKHYTALHTGHYTFEVRAVNGSLVDPTPAKKSFKIKR